MVNDEGSAQDVDQQAGDGHQDGHGTEPQGGAGTDVGVLGLGLVGGDVEDVVLAKVVVGREHEVGLVEVEGNDLALAVGIFADELDVVADTVDGEVTGHGEGFEDVDLLVGYREGAGTGHFAEDGYLVVGHADVDNRGFLEVGFQTFADEILGLVLGEPHHVEAADDGKVDIARVAHQILLQSGLGGGIIIAQGHVDGRLHGEVEGRRRLWVGGIDGDGEQILGHDLGIVERQGVEVLVDDVGVLQVGHILVGGTGGQPAGGQDQKQEGTQKSVHIFLLLIGLSINNGVEQSGGTGQRPKRRDRNPRRRGGSASSSS